MPRQLASAQRVAALRQANPHLAADALIDLMVRNTCLQVAGVGAATAGMSILPSVRTLSMVAGGALAQLDSTQRLQVELVLDVATAYHYVFRAGEQQAYLALVLGVAGNRGKTGAAATKESSATEQLLTKGGQQLANRAKQQLIRKSAGRAIPVIGVATSAGSNVLMTYTAAQRARAYIQTGPESVADIQSSLQAALGGAELQLSEWTLESAAMAAGYTMARTMNAVSDVTIKGIDEGAQRAGRAAGRFVRFLRNATTPKDP
ncbi:MAG: hypothetical protein R2932_54990 [Caldilineaceae bacterium]